MARPSMKAQRREEIFDAFERCVARYGVKGATLEKVGEEAGLARALIRHNVGNREELFDAAVDRFLENSNAGFEKLLNILPDNDRIGTLIDWLFDHEDIDTLFIQVSNGLLTEASEDKQLAKKLRRWTRDYVSMITGELAKNFPDAGLEDIEIVAVGLSSIYNSAETVGTAGPIDNMRAQSKEAVKRLVSTLR